tara:strand:+ start:272 stop:589 length:318 start_codon:yes stop_codon:yes gene_type:complete
MQDILELIKVRNCQVVAHSDQPLVLAEGQVAVVIELNSDGVLSKGKKADGSPSTTQIHAGAYGKLPDGTRITMNVMSDTAKKVKLSEDEQSVIAQYRAQLAQQAK